MAEGRHAEACVRLTAIQERLAFVYLITDPRTGSSTTDRRSRCNSSVTHTGTASNCRRSKSRTARGARDRDRPQRGGRSVAGGAAGGVSQRHCAPDRNG